MRELRKISWSHGARRVRGLHRRTEGAGFVASQDAFYRQRYDLPLLDGYEAQLGGADGNAQICHGDSGGPLLEVVVRCSRADEGARRVLRTDCSLLAQRCDAAACVDQ